MTELTQNIWLQYGFKANPFDTSALTAHANSLFPISRAIVGRSMEEDESRILTNILRSAGGARVVCEGEIGVGKTTFVNYHRYLWENEAKDRLFTPMSEIALQKHWTVKEFLITILTHLINKVFLVHGEKVIRKIRIFQEIFSLTRVLFNTSYQFEAQILGCGGGMGKSEQISVPFIPETQLLFYFQQCIAHIVQLGYAGVFLHFDNLELLNMHGTEKTRLLFEDIRDCLQIHNVYYVFVAQRGFFSEIISPLERVRSIFYGIPLYVRPLTKEEVLQAIHKRYEILSVQNGNYILPIEDGFISCLYEIYEGKIRFILDSFSQLFTYYNIPKTLDKKSAYTMLQQICKERVRHLLSSKEAEILEYACGEKQFTQKMVMDALHIQRPNVVTYLNRLLESNCIYRVYQESENVTYKVAESFKILQETALSFPKKAKTVMKKRKSAKTSDFNKRQREMLERLKTNVAITVKEYASNAGISLNTARDDLRLFQKNRIVKKTGKGRTTEYQVNQAIELLNICNPIETEMPVKMERLNSLGKENNL